MSSVSSSTEQRKALLLTIISVVIPGTGFQETSITVTTESVKEVMKLDDDETFSKFYSTSSSVVTSSNALEIEEDFSTIFEAHSPKQVMSN